MRYNSSSMTDSNLFSFRLLQILTRTGPTIPSSTSETQVSSTTTSPQSQPFTSSHFHTDLRLILGFTAAAVMIGTSAWAYFLETDWQKNKVPCGIAVLMWVQRQGKGSWIGKTTQDSRSWFRATGRGWSMHIELAIMRGVIPCSFKFHGYLTREALDLDWLSFNARNERVDWFLNISECQRWDAFENDWLTLSISGPSLVYVSLLFFFIPTRYMVLSGIQTVDAYRQGNNIFIGKRNMLSKRVSRKEFRTESCVSSQRMPHKVKTFLTFRITRISFDSVASRYLLFFTCIPCLRSRQRSYYSLLLLYQSQWLPQLPLQRMERNTLLLQSIVWKSIIVERVMVERVWFMNIKERSNWVI